MANLDERFWLDLVHRLQCVICRRFESTGLPTQAHHVATGSGKRFDCGVAALCGDRFNGGHHDANRTGSGFHGMGTARFCSVFRVPYGNEYGLIVWTIEDAARYLRARRAESGPI